MFEVITEFSKITDGQKITHPGKLENTKQGRLQRSTLHISFANCRKPKAQTKSEKNPYRIEETSLWRNKNKNVPFWRNKKYTGLLVRNHANNKNIEWGI